MEKTVLGASYDEHKRQSGVPLPLATWVYLKVIEQGRELTELREQVEQLMRRQSVQDGDGR